MKTLEMRQKRAGLIHQARGILEAAEGEKRDLTQEEQNQWDALMDKSAAMQQQIEREERQAALEADLDEPMRRANRPDPAGAPGAVDLPLLKRLPEEVRSRVAYRGLPAYQAAYERFLRSGGRVAGADARALQADSDTLGGYLLTPLQMVNDLVKAVDDVVYVRQWGRPFLLMGAESLGVPTIEADPADADWTTELATGNEDSTMAFGRRELRPHPLAKRIKVSRTLLMKAPASDGIVRDRLGYKFVVTWEKAGLTGSGAGQPLGVFTASNDGIATSRDVSTDNTTTEVTFDGLTNAKYHLKASYWPRARWLGHRDFFKMVAKLKDGNGQYLWRESVRAGEPDRLLNLPAHMSEYAPNTFTTGQYVGIVGDFGYYWYADSMAFDIQVLQELYAETNQVGMIGRWESDGMPVLGEAFARVKLS